MRGSEVTGSLLLLAGRNRHLRCLSNIAISRQSIARIINGRVPRIVGSDDWRRLEVRSDLFVKFPTEAGAAEARDPSSSTIMVRGRWSKFPRQEFTLPNWNDTDHEWSVLARRIAPWRQRQHQIGDGVHSSL